MDTGKISVTTKQTTSNGLMDTSSFINIKGYTHGTHSECTLIQFIKKIENAAAVDSITCIETVKVPNGVLAAAMHSYHRDIGTGSLKNYMRALDDIRERHRLNLIVADILVRNDEGELEYQALVWQDDNIWKLIEVEDEEDTVAAFELLDFSTRY